MKELLEEEASKVRDIAEVIEEERSKVEAKTPITEEVRPSCTGVPHTGAKTLSAQSGLCS